MGMFVLLLLLRCLEAVVEVFKALWQRGMDVDRYNTAFRALILSRDNLRVMVYREGRSSRTERLKGMVFAMAQYGSPVNSGKIPRSMSSVGFIKDRSL